MTHVSGAIGNVRILATGTAFPGERELGGRGAELSNEDVARFFELDSAIETWLASAAARGLERRFWARARRESSPEDVPDTGDLALAAARAALERANVAARDVDVLITATSTPPRISSSLASRVARELGVRGLALDLRAGGAGALQGLVLAARELAHGARHALVIGAETSSLYLDSHDPTSALLYGDGAGAAVLARDPTAGASGLVGACFGSEHVLGRPFTVPGALPPTATAVSRGEYRWQRPDGEYGRALLALWSATSRELVERFPREAETLAFFAPYAVSRPQLDAALAPLAARQPRIELVETLARHACVGSAGALVALHECLTRRRVEAGALIASTALGGGVNCAGLLWRV